jgi:predicted Rossmann fold flavoprotein
MSNVIIVGGGASGLIAGIIAARQKHKVTILEQKDKIGKKIYATGNGKCNYTNLIQTPDCYRSNNPNFALLALEQFDVNKTIEFFKQLGIYPKERKGYLYPNSEQAVSVVDVLTMELKRLKVKILCEVRVEKIKKDNGFLIITNKGKFQADKVILAAGGCASPNLGSDGSGFLLAKELGHKIIEPIPALVQLKSKEKYFKTLAGVRVEAGIKLLINKEYVTEEFGEVLMANYGVSGIPIFQISRYAARAISENKKVELVIDYMPDLNWKELYQFLIDRIHSSTEKNMEELMIGLFHHKLSYIMLIEAGIPVDLPCQKANQKQVSDLVNQIKEWHIPISEPNSFEQAQISAGGVDTNEINPVTMESKLVKGLYFAGEVIDVDGTCGGYNLQWAWTTGYNAGMGL